MPKTRKQNRRRHRNKTKRGGAPLPTSYSIPLKEFLIDNYKTNLNTIEMYQKAGISFTDARRYLGKRVPEFTQAQVDSLQQNGWSHEYIIAFNTSVPYELMLAYGSENHDDPRARSSSFDSDEETVVYRFEKPNDKFTFSEEEIERLIKLGLNDDTRIKAFEKEINDKTMEVGDVFAAIEQEQDQEQDQYQEQDQEQYQEQEQDQYQNNSSLHLSDLVVNRSSSPLYTPDSADEESSNGRLGVSDLIDDESLYTPDSGSKSSRNGGKRKRGTIRKRGKKRKSSRKRKRS